MAKISIPQSVINLHPGMLKYILSQFETSKKVETLGESINNTKRYIVDGPGVPVGATPVDILVIDMDGVVEGLYNKPDGFTEFKHMLGDRFMGYWK